MKRYLFFILFLTTVIPAIAADGIQFITAEWAALKEKAKAEKKLIFVDCYTNWCGWCKVMDKQTFQNEAVANYVNSHFISSKIEMEQEEIGKALSMKYLIASFPTYLIFSSEGKLLYKINGFMEAQPFKEELQKATDSKLQLHLKGVSDQLDPGFPDFYKKSFGPRNQVQFPKEEEINEWLDKQENKFSEASWAVMFRFSMNAVNNQWIMDNSKKLSELYGADAVDNKIARIIGKNMQKAKEAGDEKILQEQLSSIEKYIQKDKQLLKASYQVDFYLQLKKLEEAAKAMDQYIAKEGTNNPDFINAVSWAFYEQCGDSAVLQRPVEWMGKTVEKTKSYAHMDTYASLLFKTGAYTKARFWAEKAIAEGKKKGDNVSSTEELLERIKTKIR